MAQYLLPGDEFIVAVREGGTINDQLIKHIVFGYENDYASVMPEMDPVSVPVDFNRTGSIYAKKSKDGSILYVLCAEDIKVSSCQSMFFRLVKLERVSFHNFDTSECTNMYRMFGDCKSLRAINLAPLDTSNVTNFSNMFSKCESLVSLNLSTFKKKKLNEGETPISYTSMLSELPNLRRLTFGKSFGYESTMNLQNPSTEFIPKTNGKWNSLSTSTSYLSSEIPSNLETTYYAIPVNTSEYDDMIVSFGTIKNISSLMATTMKSIMRVAEA